MSIIYDHEGYCPICEAPTRFVAYSPHFRDNLICVNCPGYSIPRQRALIMVIKLMYPNWRKLRIHESSPSPGATTNFLSKALRYVGSQFYRDVPPGEMRDGFRSENLEAQSFPSNSLDLVISLDVLEHVNHPDRAFQEISRTLVSGGAHIFTVPTAPNMPHSTRKAEYTDNGDILFVGEPEYHANPIDERGSPVTFQYGYDLPELIERWSGLSTSVLRFHDEKYGIIGPMTEVYVSRKE